MLYYKCDKIDILNTIEMRTNAYPTVSCLGLIGTTPALPARPTVGLMPTIELRPEGHKTELRHVPCCLLHDVHVRIFVAH